MSSSSHTSSRSMAVSGPPTSDPELRCPSRLHGVLKDRLIEVKCNSKFCGADRETIVFHYFNPATGAIVKTVKYKNPER